jgi:hypothetical protein
MWWDQMKATKKSVLLWSVLYMKLQVIRVSHCQRLSIQKGLSVVLRLGLSRFHLNEAVACAQVSVACKMGDLKPKRLSVNVLDVQLILEGFA